MNYTHKKTKNGVNGVKSMRRDDFIEAYEWQLEEFGDSKHKIITTMPLHEYYAIGLACIDNKLSIAEFIRQSIRKNMGSIPMMAKKVTKEKENPKQGKLF